MFSKKRLEWWKIPDNGGWPMQWHPPEPPSLSRPPYKRWHAPMWNQRPHP